MNNILKQKLLTKKVSIIENGKQTVRTFYDSSFRKEKKALEKLGFKKVQIKSIYFYRWADKMTERITQSITTDNGEIILTFDGKK